MGSSLQVSIDNVIPQANRDDSSAILALWREAAAQLGDSSFTAQARPGAPLRKYRIAMDAGSLLSALEQAQAAGSFDRQREAHRENPSVSLAGGFSFSIEADGQAVKGLEAWGVVSVFLQQLELATNLVIPGSFSTLR